MTPPAETPIVNPAAADAHWLLEQAEWLYDEIVYRTHMRTRNLVMVACLLPVAWGAVFGFDAVALVVTMAYVWIVWTVIYEREVARFLPAKAACYLILTSEVASVEPV
jgi:hypothetical protein